MGNPRLYNSFRQQGCTPKKSVRRKNMFRIGEFSKLCGLSLDTLYHYDNRNILKPSIIDKVNGYRYYEAAQLVTVNKIRALKDSGFTLDEIGEVLRSNLPVSSLIELLERKSLMLVEELDRENRRLDRLRTNIFLIKNGGIPLMNEITIKSIEPILIASIRKTFHKSKFDEELTTMWKEVNDYIDLKGGKRTLPCMMIYHIGWGEMDSSETLEVEVVEPVTKKIEGNEVVKVYELATVEKMACVIHKGSFTTIDKSSKALFNWIKQNGYTKIGPMKEIYHKGEWMTSDPEEYVTEIQVAIL